jgi:transposase
MSRPRLRLVDHNSLEELEQGYRKATDAIEKSHWHIIWLYKQTENAKEIAKVVAYTPDWVRKLVRRYNLMGIAGLADLRHQNPGQPRQLSSEEEQALEVALLEKAKGQSLWSGSTVAKWVKETTGKKVSRVTGWSYLQRLDFSQQVPRPKHVKSASSEEQNEYKKNSNQSPSLTIRASKQRS